ncbi:hypothetical protein [Bradyrhizobium sp. WSM2254]|uniref:hypothetical protein n=1 Tax=Bradyrhizobium sp. WSM2254 TaxID=1188263 RepID=UPI0004218A8E|nr:hypothetical protein [Bradyrhizobium sp. WSM2254]
MFGHGGSPHDRIGRINRWRCAGINIIAATLSFVIPGRDKVANPESIHPPTLPLDGFRARPSGAPE